MAVKLSEAKEQEKYVEICAMRHKVQVKNLKEKLKKIEKETADASKQLMLFVRAESDTREQLNALEEGFEKHKNRYQEEFKALKALENYEHIDITEIHGKAALIGYTDEIQIEHEGDIYKIGKFRVTVQDAQILIENITNKRNGCDHPHVRDGRPCLGDLGSTLPKLMGKHEYALVFNVVYKYLTSYNKQSPYQKIEAWTKSRKKAK